MSCDFLDIHINIFVELPNGVLPGAKLEGAIRQVTTNFEIPILLPMISNSPSREYSVWLSLMQSY